MNTNRNSNVRKLNKKISAVMAGVIFITAIGTYTFVHSREVIAKETLDSITKVVSKISDSSPYNILEIVPSDVELSVSGDNAVRVYGLDGIEHVISGNQTMGFTGYYIGGYEPIRSDIKAFFNDSLSENDTLLSDYSKVYMRSTVSDSNMRYELADKMLGRLAERGILNSTYDDTRSILSAPVFYNGQEMHFNAYEEVREGDDLNRNHPDRDRLEINDSNYKKYGYEKLIKVYSESEKLKYTDGGEYIDRVKGSMLPQGNLDDICNYTMVYDYEASLSDNNIALDFLEYMKEVSSSMSGNEIVSTNFIYRGFIDQSENEQDDNTNNENQEDLGDGSAAEKRIINGAFEPNLKFIDQGEADISAVFRPIEKDAEFGYIVKSTIKLTEDNIGQYDPDLPVYTYYDGRYHYYGTINDINRLSAKTETHLNTIALSMPDKEEIKGDTLNEDELDSIGENDALADGGEPIYERDGEIVEALPADGLEEDALGTLSSDGLSTEVLEERSDFEVMADEGPTGNETVSEYYLVDFEYTTDDTHKTNGYYEIRDFRFSNDGRAQYKLNFESEYGIIVPNYQLNGCISAIVSNSNYNYFIYDYTHEKGNFKWEPMSYDDDGYFIENDMTEGSIRTYIPGLNNICRIRGSQIYYKLNLRNNEWFKQYVFDRDKAECAQLNLVVNRKLVTEVTTDDINKANMVIIMPGSSLYCLGEKYNDYQREVNDLSFESYKKLIERIVIDKIAAVGDYTIAERNVDGNTLPVSYTNKLINTMRLADPDVFYGRISDLTTEFIAEHPESDLDPLRSRLEVLSTNNCHFVNKNIYIYNMKWQHQEDGEYQNFVNNFLYTMAMNERTVGFTDSNNNDVYIGFEEVYDDIDKENLYRRTDGNKDPLDKHITQAKALRYIIGYKEKRYDTKKGKMRILEIEPTARFDLFVNDSGTGNGLGLNKNSFDSTAFGNGTYVTETGELYYKNRNNTIVNQEDTVIELTRMSVSEFVGHIEDISAQYDMIYIGMNTDGLNTGKATADDVPVRADKVGDTITVYNDANMRGLIYTSIGDYVYMGQNLLGNSPEDYRSDGKLVIPNRDNYKDNVDRYRGRYNGNDIAKKDVEQLYEFVEAGYPLVLADEFYKMDVTSGVRNYNEISTQRVDTMSYMYQFVNSVKDKSNVFARSRLSGSMFNWYLNLSKPMIEMFGLANSAMTNGAQYLTLSQVDGFYHAAFDFKISNPGAASSDAKYYAKLYIDINADGKYSHSQEGISLTSMSTSSGRELDKNADGEYELSAEEEYIAQCQLAGSYVGVIPWRLEVTMKDNPWRRANATGYYKVKKDQKTTINVLQVLSDRDTNNVWNLQTALANNENRFRDYVDQTDFALNIEAKTPVDFIKMADAEAGGRTRENYLKILERYDMLVLGFDDAYAWKGCDNNGYTAAVEPAMYAIRDYIDSGRSTLFTHDCTSYRSAEKSAYDSNAAIAPLLEWYVSFGPKFNRIIRNVVGMDRYNILNNDNMDEISHNYDKPYKPRSGVRSNGGMTISGNRLTIDSQVSGNAEITNDNTGFTYFALNYNSLRGANRIEVQRTDYTYEKPNNYANLKGISYDGKNTTNPTVTRVNEGQITTYPFKLPSSFRVANTHGQYFQLDFTADDDLDGESDIVVWYCLTNPNNKPGGTEIYSISPNDVRNNYYIYNKGNVTYSGVGHQKVSNEQEIKLFINTLIAAYQKGVQEPFLRVVEGYGKRARNIDNIRLAYDRFLDPNSAEHSDDIVSVNQLRGVLENNIDLYFSAEKTSLTQNSRFITHGLTGEIYYEVAESYVNTSGDSEKDKVELEDASGNKYYGVKVKKLGLECLKQNEDSPVAVADLNDLEDNAIYKVKVSVDSSVLPNIWYNRNDAGDTSVTETKNKNLRRLLVVVSDTSYNLKTKRSSSLSSIKPITLSRTQLFDLD